MSVLNRKLFSCGGQVKKYSNGGAVFVGLNPDDRSIGPVGNAITAPAPHVPSMSQGSPEAQLNLRDIESNDPGIVGLSGDMPVPQGGGVDGYSTIGTGTIWDHDYGQEDVAEFPQGRFRDAEGDILDSGVMGLLDVGIDAEDATTVEGAFDAETPDTTAEQDEAAKQEILSAAHDPKALKSTIAQNAADKSGGAISPEQAGAVIDEKSEEYSALGGDPSTFLLDFGLALMASKSPYFMTAVGEAGLVARKSAKERNKSRREDKKLKLEEGLLEYKLKKLQEDDTSGMYKSFLGKVGDLTPESQKLVLNAMSNKVAPSAIYPMMEYAQDASKKATISNFSFELEGKRVTRGGKEKPDGTVWYRDENSPSGWTEITNPYINVQAKADMKASAFNLGPKPAQKEFSGLLTRRGNMITFIAGQRQAERFFEEAKESTPFVREVVSRTQSLTEAMPKMWTAITGFATNRNSKTYKDKISQDFNTFFEENPISSEMAQWAGSAEAFQAVMFTQAIKYGAALGHTGKSMSDVDLKGWLAAVGANARTKSGFWKITSGLEEDLISTYNTDERMFLKKLSPEDQGNYSPVDWHQEHLDVGQDFGGAVARRPFGDPRRWAEGWKKPSSSTPTRAPKGSQSSDLAVWRKGLEGAYSSGGRASTEIYLRATPGMTEDALQQILQHLESGAQ